MQPMSSDRQALLIGSSVAQGFPLPPSRGWGGHLATALLPLGVQLEIRAVGGPTVDFWRNALKNGEYGLTSEELSEFDIIIMSLSLNNEGLAQCRTEWQMEQMAKYYLHELKQLANDFRKCTGGKVRLVFGSPYPNNDYTAQHAVVLKHIRDVMRTWDVLDYVLDFLSPHLHNGAGHWKEGLAYDSGHPNEIGHKHMFECIDVHSVMGMTAKL